MVEADEQQQHGLPVELPSAPLEKGVDTPFPYSQEPETMNEAILSKQAVQQPSGCCGTAYHDMRKRVKEEEEGQSRPIDKGQDGPDVDEPSEKAEHEKRRQRRQLVAQLLQAEKADGLKRRPRQLVEQQLLQQQWQENQQKQNRLQEWVLAAPPGKLAIVLGNRKYAKGTVVKKVKPESVLSRKLAAGDRIVAVDGVDVSEMTVDDITTIMGRNRDLVRMLKVQRQGFPGQLPYVAYDYGPPPQLPQPQHQSLPYVAYGPPMQLQQQYAMIQGRPRPYLAYGPSPPQQQQQYTTIPSPPPQQQQYATIQGHHLPYMAIPAGPHHEPDHILIVARVSPMATSKHNYVDSMSQTTSR